MAGTPSQCTTRPPTVEDQRHRRKETSHEELASDHQGRGIGRPRSAAARPIRPDGPGARGAAGAGSACRSSGVPGGRDGRRDRGAAGGPGHTSGPARCPHLLRVGRHHGRLRHRANPRPHFGLPHEPALHRGRLREGRGPVVSDRPPTVPGRRRSGRGQPRTGAGAARTEPGPARPSAGPGRASQGPGRPGPGRRDPGGGQPAQDGARRQQICPAGERRLGQPAGVRHGGAEQLRQ